MQSVIDRYLSVNPQRVNPFNNPTHAFVPSDDRHADADYLALVESGVLTRFYVTLNEQTQHAGHYAAMVKDGYNGNVVMVRPVKAVQESFGTLEWPLLTALRAAIEIAAKLDIDFAPEKATAYSFAGQQDMLLLAQYAADAHGDDATSWVSWTTGEAVRNG